jgi:NAD(P)H-hydrate epimerase
MRTGAGLLTSHIPGDGYPIIQAAVPESIYSIDKAGKYFSNSPETDKYSAIGVGPGIGTHVETATAFETLVCNCHKPLVIDADGINILATHPNLLPRLPANTIITPHPGEFDRLTGVSENAFERNAKQVEWSKKFNIVILLKGAYTSITLPNGDCYFNSTGNPGMATAGCGDVLTGMILSLLAQGCIPEEAAILGAFIHGMAGDLAADDCGQQTIIASDIINYIGKAIRKIENYEAFTR